MVFGEKRVLAIGVILICIVLSANASDRSADLEHGSELVNSGDYDGAISLSTEIISSDPSSAAKAYLIMGQAYRQKKDLEKAANI